ncbi:hypothetical protein NWP21_08200 [Anabaenopsis sp. FSS-46]|uniref:hypothetical protein n=1 Tax=Anabaenopsis sp. FSS-46 TaxID=2971766 RepID=UPI002473202C|nr:hypothetical protein [Anabaenopsis sp. FSS-46]MDH6098821.1 hypothetical protein [Anabaenopsis sp. FSS-46]
MALIGKFGYIQDETNFAVVGNLIWEDTLNGDRPIPHKVMGLTSFKDKTILTKYVPMKFMLLF